MVIIQNIYYIFYLSLYLGKDRGSKFYLPNFKLGKEYRADNCENIGEKLTHDGLHAA